MHCHIDAAIPDDPSSYTIASCSRQYRFLGKEYWFCEWTTFKPSSIVAGFSQTLNTVNDA
jgi:hypothetical protein